MPRETCKVVGYLGRANLKPIPLSIRLRPAVNAQLKPILATSLTCAAFSDRIFKKPSSREGRIRKLEFL